MLKRAQLESVQAFMDHPAQSGLPLHARIQRAVRQLIVERSLTAGRPLPSSRTLARSLGVSRDTVETAYAQLHAEGFIERRVGSGSFVCELTELGLKRGVLRPAGRRPALLPATAPTLSKRGQAMADSGGLRDPYAPLAFSPGVPETRLFPFAQWDRLHRLTLREEGAAALHHGDPQGHPRLRRAIAGYVNLERGARADPDQILILTSSQQALSLCARVLADPGDGVFIEDPAYQGAAKALDAAGLKRLPVAVDAQGLRTDDLLARREDGRAVFVTPSHQFPTGRTLSLDRRLALIQWAAEHDAWILEDDYDSEFHYAGRPTACVQGLDPHDRTLYLGTFTKSLFPGLRLAYLILPRPLVEPMVAARSLMDGFTASVAQLTLARFIEDGRFGAYVRTMRGVYAERLDALEAAVRARLPHVVTPDRPAGGLQMPCFLKDGFDEAETVRAARRVGVHLTGLTPLHDMGAGRPGWLMGFAASTPAEIDAAVDRLAKLFLA
nr:PLP-dependent aminotransferase family protein [Brevundimonas diminuta]